MSEHDCNQNMNDAEKIDTNGLKKSITETTLEKSTLEVETSVSSTSEKAINKEVADTSLNKCTGEPDTNKSVTDTSVLFEHKSTTDGSDLSANRKDTQDSYDDAKSKTEIEANDGSVPTQSAQVVDKSTNEIKTPVSPIKNTKDADNQVAQMNNSKNLVNKIENKENSLSQTENDSHQPTSTNKDYESREEKGGQKLNETKQQVDSKSEEQTAVKTDSDITISADQLGLLLSQLGGINIDSTNQNVEVINQLKSNPAISKILGQIKPPNTNSDNMDSHPESNGNPLANKPNDKVNLSMDPNNSQSSIPTNYPLSNIPTASISYHSIGLSFNKLFKNTDTFSQNLGAGSFLSTSTISSLPNTEDSKKGSDTIDEKEELIKAKNKNIYFSQIESLKDDTNLNLEISNVDTSNYKLPERFSDLPIPEPILTAIREMGFKRPSKIQAITLPLLLGNERRNLIAQSQNGTGKTIAFLLTVCCSINPALQYPQAIIMCPTYELAEQLREILSELIKYMNGVRIVLAVKGNHIKNKLTENIIIGTPGTLLDWTTRYRLYNPDHIRTFVLDEADIMIAKSGHKNSCLVIHRRLPSDGSLQNLFFSATFTPEVRQFGSRMVENPVVIQIKDADLTLDNIHQFCIDCPTIDSKFELITTLYSVLSAGKTIIFCETKGETKELTSKLMNYGLGVSYLTGDISIESRTEVIERFKEGKDKILIATNVIARGIDIPDTTIVINFNIPICYETREIDYDTYLHRIGRSGRFGRLGIAINLINSSYDMHLIRQIEDHFQSKITILEGTDYDSLQVLEDLQPTKYSSLLKQS